MSKEAASVREAERRRRWWALVALSLGVLLIVLESTIVYVSLPSIRQDLRLSQGSLVWVVNAFTLAFGGTLLLAGRLGDLYGHRKVFLVGMGMFALACFVCGMANTATQLVAGRMLQGLSGSIVTSVAVALIMNLFSETAERGKAMGVYSFVCLSGSSVGVLLGGVITSLLNWRWMFFSNIPIGVAVYALCCRQLPSETAGATNSSLDVFGAITMTSSLVVGVYAILNWHEAGRGTTHSLGLIGGAVALLIAFLIIESRVCAPLVPLRIFSSSYMIISNTVRLLWAFGSSASFFVAMYMQFVLGHGPLEIGLALLPGNLIMAAFSLGISAKLVARFGIKAPLTVGLAFSGVGLVLFARVPVDGKLLVDVVPGTILIAISVGTAGLPLLCATMRGIEPNESGLASGVASTVAVMGNALGLALLASMAAARTQFVAESGATSVVALTAGYRLALLFGAGCAVAAALISAVSLPRMDAPASKQIMGAALPGPDGE